MSDITTAILLAVFFSLLIASIEIIHHAKINIRFCFTFPALLYFILLTIGNICTTLAAATIIDNQFEHNLFPGYIWFWYAFIGVFGFEVIIQHINITFLNKGVLSINDWLTKAKDSAVASVLKNVAYIDVREKQAIAYKLEKIGVNNLNAHTLSTFGAAIHQKLLADAAGANVPVTLYLALALSNERLDEAKAILAANNNR
jgi:hypothetical protein